MIFQLTKGFDMGMGRALISSANYITANLIIEKQFEEIKTSGKDNDYHFVVKRNRFAIIQKSNWLLGKIWFQFQVFLGWIKTNSEAKMAVRAEINRLKSDVEVQRFFASVINLKFLPDSSNLKDEEIEYLKNEISDANLKISELKKSFADELVKHEINIQEAVESALEGEKIKIEDKESEKGKFTLMIRLKKVIDTQKITIQDLEKENAAKDELIQDLRNSLQKEFFDQVKEGDALDEKNFANELTESCSSDDNEKSLEEEEPKSYSSLIRQLSSEFEEISSNSKIKKNENEEGKDQFMSKDLEEFFDHRGR